MKIAEKIFTYGPYIVGSGLGGSVKVKIMVVAFFFFLIFLQYITSTFRMKKVAPEVRMTEAARKRSAKIRQDKESAENKGPASPRLRTPITQLPRGKNTENRTKELALEENINLLS